MERRRLEAARELMAGARQSDLARKYGVSRTTAFRWFHTLTRAGLEGLKRSRATGRPSYLTGEQWERLREVYRAGARAYTFADDRWTTSRLAAVIEAEFGVRYQLDYVRRLKHRLRQEASTPPTRHSPQTLMPVWGSM